MRFLPTGMHCEESSFTDNQMSKNTPLSSFITVLCFRIQGKLNSRRNSSPRHHTEHRIIFAPITLLEKGEISPHSPLTVYNPICWAETALWLQRTQVSLVVSLYYWQTLPLDHTCQTQCLQALWKLNLVPSKLCSYHKLTKTSSTWSQMSG